jgi:hypothetical protein
VHDPLELVPAVALCGGVGCYLVAQVAFRRRCGEPLERQRLGVAVLCGALVLAGVTGDRAPARPLSRGESRPRVPAGLSAVLPSGSGPSSDTPDSERVTHV